MHVINFDEDMCKTLKFWLGLRNNIRTLPKNDKINI